MTEAEPSIDPLFAAYLRDPPRLSYTDPADPWWSRTLISSLEACLGRTKLERLYWRLKAENRAIETFFEEALAAARISVEFDAQRLAEIPSQGPLVIVANHPFGVIDGVILCDLALKSRGDFRILLHALLCQDSAFGRYFLPIDFQPSMQATRTNIRSKQLALESLKQGIPVLIFPSGMVATADRGGFGQVVDGPWTTFAAKIIREARATVLPCYFHGRNSRLFHLASHVAQPLRTALLLHEAANKFGRQFRLEIGAAIPWERLEEIEGRQRLTDTLYQVVQDLGKHGATD